MASRLKFRKKTSRCCTPQIAIPNLERNGDPLVHTTGQQRALMALREMERCLPRVTRKVKPLGVRQAPYLVRTPRAGGRYTETNMRYPLREIIAAKNAGRRMKPQTKAAHWK